MRTTGSARGGTPTRTSTTTRLGHALSDPVEAAAWRRVLERTLPPAPARVLDAGTGTGSLAIAAAELGYAVTGVDLSEGMLERARAKATERGIEIDFTHGAAEAPPVGPFDAVIERHVLWTIPDPVAALEAWRSVAAPGGRLVLLEGSWGGEGPFVAVADAAAVLVERAFGIADHHHATYPDDLPLPLQGLHDPGAVRGRRRIGGMGADPRLRACGTSSGRSSGGSPGPWDR